MGNQISNNKSENLKEEREKKNSEINETTQKTRINRFVEPTIQQHECSEVKWNEMKMKKNQFYLSNWKMLWMLKAEKNIRIFWILSSMQNQAKTLIEN